MILTPMFKSWAQTQGDDSTDPIDEAANYNVSNVQITFFVQIHIGTRLAVIQIPLSIVQSKLFTN